MEVSAQQKEELYKKILRSIIAGLRKGTLTSEGLPDIASYVLSHVRSVNSKVSLDVFLHEFSEKWPVFHNLQIVESGNLAREGELRKTEDILTLVKEGKVDEALALAKKTNE